MKVILAPAFFFSPKYFASKRVPCFIRSEGRDVSKQKHEHALLKRNDNSLLLLLWVFGGSCSSIVEGWGICHCNDRTRSPYHILNGLTVCNTTEQFSSYFRVHK